MRLYVVTVESDRKPGRTVKLAVHTTTARKARELVRRRYNKWNVVHVAHVTGPRAIAFLDSFPI